MTFHVGLIGCGNISRTHANAVAAIPNARVSAVFGPHAEKVKLFCDSFGGQPYSDLQPFLAHRPLDVVIVGSPSGLHATQGIMAARKGLHVLVEKPMDISSERAQALIDACEAAGVKLGVIFQDRMQPGICRLKTLLEKNRLGRPLLVDARVRWYRPPEYYSGSNWRGTWALDGGGALMNQGIHTVDLILWLFGDVLRVRSQTSAVLHDIETEDTAQALLEFASGAMGVFQATTAAYPGYPRSLEVTGSAGTAVLEHDRLVAIHLKEAGATEEVQTDPTAAGDLNLSQSSPVVGDSTAHRRIIEDFLRAVQEDRKPICDGREGCRSVALVEAIYQAARESQPVQLAVR